MGFKLPNRTEETWTGTGTGAVVPAGAADDKRAFSASLSNGDTTILVIVNPGTGEWEITNSTYTSASNSLSRGTLIDSSTGSRVDFTAGTKQVFCDVDGARLLDLLDGGESSAHSHAAPTTLLPKSGQPLCVLDPTRNVTPAPLYAWAFTSGGTYEVVAGNTITGATSTKTAVVWAVYLTSGTWAGGDAAGWLFTSTHSGTFTSGENVNVGANNNVATMTGSPTANIAPPSARASIPTNLYDTTTPECGWYQDILRSSYAGGGINVILHVSMVSATSNTVGWLVLFRRVGNGSLDVDLTTGWTTYKTVAAETVPGTAGKVLIHAALAFANGSEMASIAAGEQFQIAVIRDVVSDSATGDAELQLIEIKEQ